MNDTSVIAGSKAHTADTAPGPFEAMAGFPCNLMSLGGYSINFGAMICQRTGPDHPVRLVAQCEDIEMARFLAESLNIRRALGQGAGE